MYCFGQSLVQRSSYRYGSYVTTRKPRPTGMEAETTPAPPPGSQLRRATMRDVAQEAGVSVSAVSKILRGAYGSSPEMRTKVLGAMEKWGSRPKAGARAM